VKQESTTNSYDSISRRSHKEFLRLYLSSFPQSITKLSLGGVPLADDVAALIPLQQLTSLTLRDSGAFATESNFALNQHGVSGETAMNLRLEKLVLDDRYLTSTNIIDLIHRFPTIQYFDITVRTMINFDEIAQALESVSNICTFSLPCSLEWDREHFRRFKARCEIHCCRNRLRRAQHWSTSSCPVGFYAYALRNIDQYAGPLGLYSILREGKVLSDLRLS